MQIYSIFFHFYSIIVKLQNNPRMQVKRQLTAKLVSKEKYFIRFNETGVFECKQNEPKQSKKLFNFSKKLYIRIIKTQITNNSKYKFIVKIVEEAQSIDVMIEGKEELQKLYKIIGPFSLISGLQQIVTSFKKIGEGSFAQVYEAITNYQSKFALKSFEKKGMEGNEKTKKAFNNEMDILKKLNNPYIVSFDYIYETEKAYYLKMQYFQKTLKDKVTGKLLVKNQKVIMRQLLNALLEMKNKNVIHRDLKPDNIMVRKNAKGEEECVIIDFGLSTFSDANPYLFFRCGTPGFLAPEIANLTNKKEKQLCSSDMFSLGCIFYKILTGHYLFTGKTAKDVLQRNRKCEYAHSAFDRLSLKEKDLLIKMIEMNPAIRITPEEALLHSYFEQDIDDCDEIPQEECGIEKNLKKIANINPVKNMESVYSSVESLIEHSTNSQAYHRGIDRKSSLHDSCVTFEFGLRSVEGKSSEDENRLKRSIKSHLNSSRTPDKMRRQSRFSKLGKDISNLI